MAAPHPFIEIPSAFLQEIAQDSNRIPKLYYAKNPLLRKTFWLRLSVLARLIQKHQQDWGTCLDFGGGSGVMLPTLCARFASLTLVDLEASQAALVKDHFALKSVAIVQEDIASLNLGSVHFDAAVAADVLEHFQDLQVPIAALRRLLKPDGILYTSLPTENWLYVTLRKVFGIQKPWDHYHTGYEVEAMLKQSGFQRLQTKHVPVRFAPLFLVSAWRRTGE